MDSSASFFSEIRDLIAQNELEKAIQVLTDLLEGSPKLNTVVQQSARLVELKSQMDLGVIDTKEANLTKNQIRVSLLKLVHEIETQSDDGEIQAEIEQFANGYIEKSIITGNITAGGNVDLRVGDEIQTESKTSRYIRIFLFVLVPVLAIGAAFFYIQNQELSRPLSLNVAIENRSPNPELPFEKGVLILNVGPESDTQSIVNKVVFQGIPGNYKGELINLKFYANGFHPIDTTLILENPSVILPIQRDDTYARLFGLVTNEEGQPIQGVTITVKDLETKTDENGRFNLSIPFDKQSQKQSIVAVKEGYEVWDRRAEPVLKNVETRIVLERLKID